MSSAIFTEADGIAVAGASREEDSRRQLVQRIVSTPDFVRSPQLSRFLLYICNAVFEQQTQQLSEHHIGVEVFGRRPDYDSAADTIVRSHALRLRRKLEQYFLRGGAKEPMRLEIPRGTYVPVFTLVDDALLIDEESAGSATLLVVAEPRVSPTPDPAREPAGKTGFGSIVWRYRLLTSLLLLCVITLCTLFALHLRTHFVRSRRHMLWGQLFTENQPTRIVLGDSGLVLFHAVTHQHVSLHDYLNNDYQQQMQHVEHVDPDFAAFLLHRRYTSFVDAMTLGRIMRLPEASPQQTLVQYSRDMHVEDFNTANLILIGAQEAVPWLELFEKHMDFVFSIDNPKNHSSFRNGHPKANEVANYNDEQGKAYGVIAFVPNLSGNGNALILEGLNMMGTEAAIDLVTDDARILPILKSIRKPDGTLPHFEMLIGSDAVGEGAGPAHVIAMHTHD